MSFFCAVRLLWLLVLIGLVTLFTFLISSKVEYLMSHPKNVDVNVEFKPALEFPAITICNHNMLRYTH